MPLLPLVPSSLTRLIPPRPIGQRQEPSLLRRTRQERRALRSELGGRTTFRCGNILLLGQKPERHQLPETPTTKPQGPCAEIAFHRHASGLQIFVCLGELGKPDRTPTLVGMEQSRTRIITGNEEYVVDAARKGKRYVWAKSADEGDLDHHPSSLCKTAILPLHLQQHIHYDKRPRFYLIHQYLLPHEFPRNQYLRRPPQHNNLVE